METPVVIGLNAVIVAVTEEVPRILTVRRTNHRWALPPGLDLPALPGDDLPEALPFGPLDPELHRTLETGLRSWVREQTGVELTYTEQLYTFGDRFRDPRERQGGPRVISVAYLTLVRERKLSKGGPAQWRDVYTYLPWEDWRAGRPAIIDKQIASALCDWARHASNRSSRLSRQERIDICFGLGGASWDGERVLDRYELLYEARLVAEARRDDLTRKEDSERRRIPQGHAVNQSLGRPMALDHRRMLATALGRLRGKLKYRPVVFDLLPPLFTLLQLQRIVEALAGLRLHKQNFRRLVERAGLVEGTGKYEDRRRGRPAELFRFRREVLREHLAPGVGLPGARQIG